MRRYRGYVEVYRDSDGKVIDVPTSEQMATIVPTTETEESEELRIQNAADVIHGQMWADYREQQQYNPPKGEQHLRSMEWAGQNICDLMPPVPEVVMRIATWAVSIAPKGLSGSDVGFAITGSGGVSGDGPKWEKHPTIEYLYERNNAGNVFLFGSGCPNVEVSTRITSTYKERVRFWRGY